MTWSGHRDQMKEIRVRSRSDLELQLTEFDRTLGSLMAERGSAPSSDQVARMQQFLSQAVHILFAGSAWTYASSKLEQRKMLLDAMRDAFTAAEFRPSDFEYSIPGLDAKLIDARAYELIVAAIRANSPEFLDMARALSPMDQADLFAKFAVEPEDPVERDLESAINQYARNERVQLGSAQPSSSAAPIEAPRLVIHAGITKTGSTYIQNFLDLNRPALLRRGIWVPEVGIYAQPGRPHKQAGHSRFVQAAVRDDQTLRQYIRRGLQIAPGAIHTIILSSEAFFLHDESHRIPAYLGDFPTEALIYLRRQDEWANSQYCEFVGGGAIGRVSETFDEWIMQPTTRERMDYRCVLERFAEVLGQARVHVRVYDRQAFPEGDIIADLAEALALPELLDLPRPGVGGSNDPRISAPHIDALREYNGRKFASSEGYLGFIEDITRRLCEWRRDKGIEMPPPDVVTPEARQRLIEQFAEINSEIARDWMDREDGRLFDVAIPKAIAQPPPLYPEEKEILESAYTSWRRYSNPSHTSWLPSVLSRLGLRAP